MTRENQVIQPLGGNLEQTLMSFDRDLKRTSSLAFISEFTTSFKCHPVISSSTLDKMSRHNKVNSIKDVAINLKTRKAKEELISACWSWEGGCVESTFRVALLSPFQKSFLNSHFIDAQLRRRRTRCRSLTHSYPIIPSLLTLPVSFDFHNDCCTINTMTMP